MSGGAGDSSAAAVDDRPLGMPMRIVVLLLAAAGLVVATTGDFGILLYAPNAVVGAILAIRRPRNPIGWLLIFIAWAGDLTAGSIPIDPTELVRGTAPTWAYAFAWLGTWVGNALFSALLLLMIIFPGGRLPTGRWRAPAILALAVTAVMVVGSGLQPTLDVSIKGVPSAVTIANPLAIFPDAPFWQILHDGLAFLVILAMLIAGFVSMFVRWRRSVGVEAQQLRWVVFSLAAVIAAVIIGILGVAITRDDNAPTWYLALLAYPLPPIAIGIAVLRYRLYEIDRIVSRTIGWAIVTGILVAAYIAAILLLGNLLAGLANRNTIVVAASTLAIAALFQPVRRRVQAAVDRRFNRARIDAEQTATAFAGRLRDEVDIDALTADLRSTIARAVQPTTSAIWLRSSSRPQSGSS